MPDVVLPDRCTVCRKENPKISEDVQRLIRSLRPGEATLAHVCDCGWREWYCNSLTTDEFKATNEHRDLLARTR